jgi:hypothetical protein
LMCGVMGDAMCRNCPAKLVYGMLSHNSDRPVKYPHILVFIRSPELETA